MRKFKKRKSNNRIKNFILKKNVISIIGVSVLCSLLYLFTCEPFVSVFSFLSGFFLSKGITDTYD